MKTEPRHMQDRLEQAERELEHQRRVIGRITAGEPLTATLDELCRHVEDEFPGVTCSIMLLDRVSGRLRQGAAPSLPPTYMDVIDGLPVGDGFGACGTAAARGENVIVEDIHASAVLNGYVELLDAHGLRSLWSHPLLQVSGEALGTFDIHRSEPHRPSAAEIGFVESVGTLAALAIARANVGPSLVGTPNIDRRTGLPNRSRFLELVNERLLDHRERVSVMLLEVDRFRQIGDTLGYLLGDRMLVAIAERLTDAVGDDALIARYSDEGFALTAKAGCGIAPNSLATRVLAAFDAPISLGGGEFFPVATLGIAHSDGDTDAYGLMRDAAAAMHVAQAEGLGRQQVYDERLRARVIERIATETALRHAIRNDELVMHYQPILNLRTGEWDRVEALVRWQDPQRGLIPPAEFIPLAEQTGLIVPLGERVVEMVASETRRWIEVAPDLKVAVNVSVMQLASPTFAREFLGLLEQTPLPPGALVVEVTESALMQNFETMQAALAALREAGIGVALDDFGTGYSSLARLGELPITSVKVDRRFIRRLVADDTARSIVRAVADIASAHGISTTAEGIEDGATLAEVVALGVDRAQGYHLSRPITVEEARKLVTEPLPARLRGYLDLGRVSSNGASSNGASTNGASSHGASPHAGSSHGASPHGASPHVGSSNGASTNGAPSHAGASNGASPNGASSNGSKPHVPSAAGLPHRP